MRGIFDRLNHCVYCKHDDVNEDQQQNHGSQNPVLERLTHTKYNINYAHIMYVDSHRNGSYSNTNKLTSSSVLL